MLRWIAGLLVTLLVILQYQIWFSHGGILNVWALEKSVAKQEQKRQQYEKRNQQLVADIKDLKQGHQAVEERARNNLGMIKKDEIFYQVVK